jgi:hypothetical protein
MEKRAQRARYRKRLLRFVEKFRAGEANGYDIQIIVKGLLGRTPPRL